MLALLREGFWRDALALVVIAVVLGGLAVGGVARGVEAYLTRAVSGLVGAPGEYDAIVHVRQDAGEEALRLLSDRLAQSHPGFLHRQGPDLAGYLNVLIRLPDDRRTQEGFESLRPLLENVPGFDGITYIVEPAVVVSDVNPALRRDFIDYATGLSEVEFAFASGSSVWAVVSSPDHVDKVQRALEAFASARAILDIRLPVALDPGLRDTLAWDIVAKLEQREPELRVSTLEVDREEEGPAADLRAAREVIARLSEFDSQELRSRLLEAADLIESAASGLGGDDQAEISYVLEAFSQAVDQLQLLEVRLAEVARQLRGAAEEGQASDVLIALLIQKLIDRLGGQEPVEPPRSAVDVEELRSGIEAIASRIRSLEALDLDRVASSLRELAFAFPEVEQEASERILAVIDSLVEQSPANRERLLLYARGVSDQRELRQRAIEAAGEPVRVYVQSSGVVQPDPRTAMLQLLVGARRVVVALAALLFFLLVYVFDVTTLLSFVRRNAEVNGESHGKTTAEVALWGGLFGAVTFGAMVWLASGTELVSVPSTFLVGWLMGALLSFASERLGGVDPAPYLSALSLGIAEPDLMREVIIPAGRPGILYWLTRPGRKLGWPDLQRAFDPGVSQT